MTDYSKAGSVMHSAYNLCPDHIQGQPARMRWVAEYFLTHYAATPPAAALAPRGGYWIEEDGEFGDRKIRWVFGTDLAAPTPSTPAPQSAGNRATYEPPRDPEFSFSEGVAKGYADGWNACLDASTPAPVAIYLGRIEQPHGGEAWVELDDFDLKHIDWPDTVRTVYSAPPTRPDVGDDLVELLRSIRPEFGAVGSRDVDVRAQQQRIDKAIALLAPQSSEKEDQVIAAKPAQGE